MQTKCQNYKCLHLKPRRTNHKSKQPNRRIKTKERMTHQKPLLQVQNQVLFSAFKCRPRFRHNRSRNPNYMTNENNITSFMRLIKKSTNSPLRITFVTDKNSYDSIIKEGKIKIGFTSIKVTPWNFGEQSSQCFICLKFGHSSKSCKAPPCCLRCVESHNFKECKMKDETRFQYNPESIHNPN